MWNVRRWAGVPLCSTTLDGVELPVIDPANLLDIWMQWEKGEMMPGLTLSKLKKAGMRELIEQLVAQIEPAQIEPAQGEPGQGE